MINTIAWKTYFVFFCFNLCFIPIVSIFIVHLCHAISAHIPISKVYFFFPEPNGWKLETLDSIFNEAHEKGENPVFTEKRWRKNGWQKAADAQSRDKERQGQGNEGGLFEEKSVDNAEHFEGRPEGKEVT